MKLLRHTQDLLPWTLCGLDGEVGFIQDLYFDDHSWAARYFTVHTGGWLSGRIVLIAPVAVVGIDAAHTSIQVHLQKEQIAQAPSIDTTKPISRQDEKDYHQYYGWKPYWHTDPTGLAGPTYDPDSLVMTLDKPLLPEPSEPPHLSQTAEMIGYDIHTSDGAIGQVQDFLVDEVDWVVRYAAVDTQKWSSGKIVLAQTRQVEQIDYSSRTLTMSLTRQAIQSAPDYDPAEPITPDYEMDLFQHYRKAA
jgi:hypothetical protein